MNAGRRHGDQPERSGNDEARTEFTAATGASLAGASLVTAEPPLYAGLAEWLDRDLARLEDLYKGWSTAGYGQWRRSFKAMSR